MAFFMSALTACAAPGGSAAAGDSATPASGAVNAGIHPEWSRNAVIYEVNVRQYTPEGTFTAFQKHLPRIRALGVDVLWFMPIQPIGTLNRKGTLGRYYSIRDYTAFNPEFGTEAEFKALVDAAHALGFKVILDWVANHTSHDHHWTREHPEWHTRRADGSLSRPIEPRAHRHYCSRHRRIVRSWLARQGDARVVEPRHHAGGALSGHAYLLVHL